MALRRILVIGLAVAAASAAPLISVSRQSAPQEAPRRNVVIVVFDGMRGGSVNPTDAPTMDWVRNHGVNFANSHSLFPTFTTANASAIATGHYLGDTGDFSNTIYIGHPVFLSGDFGHAPGTYAPYIENDAVLGDLDAQFGGNYLNEETLLSAARLHGFNTAAVGKMGPAAIQDVSQLNPVDGKFTSPQTVIIDDGTGTADGTPLSPEVSSELSHAGLPTATPVRKQPTGTNTVPGTMRPNIEQQAFFTDAVTRAILPMFKRSGKPFVLLYWSRDPDGTQHFQGDSLNQLVPGINGPTSKAAVKNADSNLKQILDYIHGDTELAADTDIFLTADHGFATISKHDIDAAGHETASYSAKWIYRDAQGRQEVNTGFLPQGFLAIDLAHELGLPLFDPDTQISGPDGKKMFQRVDPTIPQQQPAMGQRPANGNGLIGGTGRIANLTDAKVVVAANGGSDLIYLPAHDPDTMATIIRFLAQQDYVGGLFVDDNYGKLPGALPLSAIRLAGSSKVPRPSIVVAFKTFSTDPEQQTMTGVQITDSNLQQGQGMHGSFGRANTFNFMAAIGPDFKESFVDPAPVSNADIAPTLAKILSLSLSGNGQLRGRIIEEALAGGPASIPFKPQLQKSPTAANGKGTILMYERVAKQVYFDQACFKDAKGSAQAKCP
jgi:type I phosphodiesterase/nucleotide pyrophosphatase